MENVKVDFDRYNYLVKSDQKGSFDCPWEFVQGYNGYIATTKSCRMTCSDVQQAFDYAMELAEKYNIDWFKAKKGGKVYF